ncbi:MAG TPA: DUF4242 domain-containing protein [Gemmatimonadota bacterium]
MPTYLVERFLRDLTSDQLSDFARAARRAAGEAVGGGQAVRYLRSVFVPGEKRCYCLFEAPSAAAVRKVNERAELPFERVIEAVQVSVDELDRL